MLLVLGVVWLIVLLCLWFPDLMPLPSFIKQRALGHTKVDAENGGPFLHAQAFQMARFNKSALDQGDIIHVCITSDENTLGGMVALVNSIDLNTRHPVMFHLVVDQNSLAHIKTWIEGSHLRDIMYEVKAFPEEWVAGKIQLRGSRPELGKPLNYARYYMPRLFPDLHGRIIFIDDDAIVQGDLYDLYTMELKSNTWAAFSDDCTGSNKRITMMKNVYSEYIDFKNKQVQLQDMSPMECSFNSGVYVTEMDLWRKNNITEQLERWMTLNTVEEVYGNEKGGGGSQPPMMLVFYKKYTHLDPNWHVRYLGWTRGTSYTAPFLRQAKLLHWNGPIKPWARASQHSNIWDRYFIQDPMKRFVPVRKS